MKGKVIAIKRKVEIKFSNTQDKAEFKNKFNIEPLKETKDALIYEINLSDLPKLCHLVSEYRAKIRMFYGNVHDIEEVGSLITNKKKEFWII